MSPFDWLQLTLYFPVLLLLVKPLGNTWRAVYQGERMFLTRLFAPIERLIYKLLG